MDRPLLTVRLNLDDEVQVDAEFEACNKIRRENITDPAEIAALAMQVHNTCGDAQHWRNRRLPDPEEDW